ncbi:PREDICTED: uncharacterized protein LOC104748271 [Camelina sativa]|uniref:Uncharacterized protein LOC104748271 n=1 Tax=Camelina sativa TaxID=90675 RepID=A0ABM0WAT6_CAMSA|nr:PREDICTED: uncharacterized protein LOC104748271 [Camelina sativa]
MLTNPNPNPTPTPTLAMNATVEVRRTISPYDLTSADNSGAVISHPLLKGINYDEWACGMKTALTSCKKFGFLDGTIAKPADGSSDLEDWWTIQALLVSWIKMSIDPMLRSTISHRDVAKDLWDYLKKRFAVMNGARIQQIQSELACCKQRGLAIEAYFGKLNRIWDSLAAYRPIRVCSCGLCTCNVGAAQENDGEEDKVHQFWCGLDDHYRAVRSSLVARVPVQSLEEVYNIVRQEEDLRAHVEEKPEVTSFAVHTKPRFRLDEKEKEKGMLCKLCNHYGHVAENYYTAIGYPEWWGDRPKSQTIQGRGRGGSSSTGGLSSGKGRGSMTYANRVHVPNLDKEGHEQANHVITDQDRDGVTGLTDQQWRSIKSILNAGKDTTTEKVTGKSSTPSWIMDTGASHHLTGKFEILSDVRDMAPVLVIMANGREQVSLKEGTIQLGPDLVLKSVYFVENFKTDLISMGQLMDENRCVVQSADTFLVVQDHSMRTVIGAGKRVGGTFHFCKAVETALSVTLKDGQSFELWHKRMGHPSPAVVGLLPCFSDSVSVKNLNKACDVCLCAKQTRDCFHSV